MSTVHNGNPDRAALVVPRRRLLFAAVVAAFALGTFTFVYAFFWGLVGRFPAESLQLSDRHSNAVSALCYVPSDHSRSFSTFRSPDTGRLSRTPVFRFDGPSHRRFLSGIASSRALLYTPADDAVHLLNALDPNDITYLDLVSYWGGARSHTAQAVIAAAATFSPVCTDPYSDIGLTEAYWATKGTGVIHHWAFLYEPTVHDGKVSHAQYGTFVASVARAILNVRHEAGPTAFVRIGWWVFYAVGLAAALAFLAVFRREPMLAAFGLLGEVNAFTSLGSFSILLAPGYHWTREFVIVAMALLVALITRYRLRHRVVSIVALALGLGLFYALDPSFTLLAVASYAIAFAIASRTAIVTLVRTRPRSAIGAALVSALAILALAFADRGNLAYIIVQDAASVGMAFADGGRNAFFAFDIALVAMAVGLAWYGRVPAETMYFGFVTLGALAYYSTTPDKMHFGKFVGYAIPFYVALGIAAFAALRRTSLRSSVRGLEIALFLVACYLTPHALQNVLSAHPNWELRTYDAEGAAYFASRPVSINGRVIDADLNDEGVRRLRDFPSTVAHDYVLSALDKYVLFLYDDHNGFAYVDGLSAMSSDERMLNVEADLTARHGRVLFDRGVLSVDPLSGLLSTHPVFGGNNDQSVGSFKAQVRYNEIAAYLYAHCTVRRASRGGEWFYAGC